MKNGDEIMSRYQQSLCLEYLKIIIFFYLSKTVILMFRISLILTGMYNFLSTLIKNLFGSNKKQRKALPLHDKYC